MFETFFKYSRTVYENGLWAFRNMPSSETVVIGALLILAVLALIYAKTVAPTSRHFRGTLALLKLGAIALILLSLAEPFISITSIVPRKSTVLVLLDDSESMTISGGKGDETRSEKVEKWLRADDAGVIADLEKNFNVVVYKFSEYVSAFGTSDTLQGRGPATDIGGALRFVENLSQTTPLSAVLIATDGAQTQLTKYGINGGKNLPLNDPLQAAALLKNLKIPIYSVGVGATISNDLRITRVSATRSTVGNDEVEMTALVQARSYAGKNVEVQLLENGRVVASENVSLSGALNRVKLLHLPSGKGHLQYAARVVPLADESITINNEKKFLVNNSEKIGKILYIEELHPYDFKFLKRAIDLDKNLRLISMVRVGKDRFLRQGVLNKNELSGNFPTTREQLFSYQALILGSIEAEFFTEEQHALIRDFVSIRGGSLLMLGGPRGFTQGGWQESVVADVLPVHLLDENDAAREFSGGNRGIEYKLKITPDGLRTAFLQFSSNALENEKLWDTLPPLIGFNPVGSAKPGATVLGVHPLSQKGRDKVLMATQRYGRGRSMILATSTSWKWQMKLPSTDMRHETFWHQIGRWLAFSSPASVELSHGRDNYTPDEIIQFSINALDSSFAPVENAQISFHVTAPSKLGNPNAGLQQSDSAAGRILSLEVKPDLKETGRYNAQFSAKDEGLYEVETLAHDKDGRFLGRATTAFFVHKNRVEFAKPDLNESLLKRISEVSGGKYVHISDANDIADELVIARSSFSKTVERDIWDTPALYLLILALLAAEWSIRRARGLS